MCETELDLKDIKRIPNVDPRNWVRSISGEVPEAGKTEQDNAEGSEKAPADNGKVEPEATDPPADATPSPEETK